MAEWDRTGCAVWIFILPTLDQVCNEQYCVDLCLLYRKCFKVYLIH